MNWLAFAVAAWLCLGLELGLREMLHIGPQGIAPSFVVALLVFVALNASQRASLWAAIVLGVLTDLTGSIATLPRGSTLLIGPHAVGFVVAAQAVLALRGMVVSRNPVAMGVLAMLAGVVSSIIVVAFLTAHKLIGDPIVWEPTQRLIDGLLNSAFTGIVATVLAIALIPMSGLFGFPQSHRRFGH